MIHALNWFIKGHQSECNIYLKKNNPNLSKPKPKTQEPGIILIISENYGTKRVWEFYVAIAIKIFLLNF